MAAALLNLTGLALGYAYLGRWWRTALYAAGTVLLVVLAFATDAASRPWLWRVLAVVWLAWMAFDGWRLARRTSPGPLTARSRAVPATVAVLLVGAVVAGYLLYGAAGRRAYAAGLAAQGRADCTTAIMKYDTVAGPYELTLSRDVPAATANREQCAAFAAATDAEARGTFADAVRLYQNYRQAYPGTVLVPFVHENLKRTYADWAGSLRAARDYPGAILVYRDLLAESGTEPGAAQVRGDLAATYVEQADAVRAALPGSVGAERIEKARSAVDALLLVQREFGDTPSAPKVPQAIVDTFTAANSLFTEQRFCEALPVLDYFVALPDAETAGVVGAANGNRAQAQYACGLTHYRAMSWGDAVTQLEQFVATYPGDLAVAQARSAILAARVGREGGSAPAVLPEPLGGNSPGSIPLTLYNDNPADVVVLVVGQTAHEVVVPGCPSCPARYASEAEGCPSLAGKPSVTLRLRPGDYSVVGTHVATSGVNPLISTHALENGFVYSSCLFISPR